jgi:glycosyltransferase involved in cell wall biosynthesis
MTDPKISVIFPVGDRQAFLAEAIESILNQSFVDFELLAVLDGVSPPVQAIVEGYRDPRMRIIALPVNLGVSTARNAAMRLARAPYMALMDSDDVALPRRLERQYAWMQAHPTLTVCASNAVKLLKTGRRAPMRYPQSDGLIKARLLLVDSAIINPTVMFRTDFVRHHGLVYDANLPRDQDHRFFVEMMRLGASFHGLQEELLLYRRHPGNITQDRTGVDEEKTRVREMILPLYFPELSGAMCRVLLKGFCEQVRMTREEGVLFVQAADRAAQEQRVFRGEDRAELRRLLAHYRQRMWQLVVSGAAPRAAPPGA